MAKKKLSKLAPEEFEAIRAEFDCLFAEFYPEYAMHRRDNTLMEHIKSNQEFAYKSYELMKLGKKIGIDIEQYIFEYGTEHNWQ